MKKVFQLLLSVAVMATSIDSFAGDCVNCGPKDVSGMPKNASFDNIEKITKSKLSANDRLYEIKDFCLRFNMSNQQMIGSLIKDMLKTQVTPEEFFTEPFCQPETYSSVVKCPMLHLIAEDITKREEFLKNIWMYYSKKLKKPELFDQIIQAKNTKGETILDYLETMRLNKQYEYADSKASLKIVIKMLCDHGAVYSVRKNVECPKQ